ncbi:MAG TPA: DUF1153 domain-containing protein [Rhizomicrobium sp.]|nr:DUF1153 domain-containing protein [Rhizomicrobium sp.]
MADTDPHSVSEPVGPNKSPFGLKKLPSSQTVRWVVSRKAEVLTAVRSGFISVDDACKRYGISMDEFIAWRSAMDRFGPRGLRASHINYPQASASKVNIDNNGTPPSRRTQSR